MAAFVLPQIDNMFDAFLNSDAFATPNIASAAFDLADDKDVFSDSFLNLNTSCESILSGYPDSKLGINNYSARQTASYLPMALSNYQGANIDPALEHIGNSHHIPRFSTENDSSTSASLYDVSHASPISPSTAASTPLKQFSTITENDFSKSNDGTRAWEVDARRQSITSSSASPQANPEENATQKPKKKAGRRRKLSAQESSARRDSLLERNRRAAEKCRTKKKEQEENLREEFRGLAQKNRELKDEYQELLQEVAGLRAVHQWETGRELAMSERWSGNPGGNSLEIKLEKGLDSRSNNGTKELDLDGMDLDADNLTQDGGKWTKL